MNKEITLLALVIFFCLLSAAALILNTRSKSRAPLVIFAVSALMMVSFCVYMIIDKSEEAKNGAKDYITLTSADSSAAKQSGRKTHKSSAADSENKSIPSKSDDDIVYITKNGSKYHFDIDCGEYEFYECTLRQAKEMGLEPCSRCAQ